ncbi:hypothetical protein [Vibrio harveyi]|uniref:hypothetical protein n=1 Tax=Vibrio harveyi TaxID=669 RepID=UPI003CF6BC8A
MKRTQIKLLGFGTVLLFAGISQCTKADEGKFTQSDDLYQSLRLRMKNELRIAERPSASPDDEIEAWVQGFLVDYKLHNITNWLDVNAYGYTVQKLLADPEKSTRFYLDGHDSFYLYGASLDIKPLDGMTITVGRFITDKGYGSFDAIPLLEYTSVRTLPSMKEGILLKQEFDDLNVFGAVTFKNAGGYDADWVDEGIWEGFNLDGSKKIIRSPRYNLAMTLNEPNYGGGFGLRYQADHSVQYQLEPYYSFPTELGAVRLDGRFFYADLLELEKERNEDDYTFVFTGMVSYFVNDWILSASAGQVGPKLSALTNVDTDIVYPFDQSISRNNQYTTAWSLGSLYQFSKEFSAGLFIVKTDGYLDNFENVSIDGTGGNLVLMYNPNEGTFKGMKSSLILNKAKEYLKGDIDDKTRDYFDIKMSIQYDFNLI